MAHLATLSPSAVVRAGGVPLHRSSRLDQSSKSRTILPQRLNNTLSRDRCFTRGGALTTAALANGESDETLLDVSVLQSRRKSLATKEAMSRIDDLFDQVGGIESRPALPRKPGKGASMEEHFGSEVHMRGSHGSISGWHEDQWAALGEALEKEQERILNGTGLSNED